MELSIIVPVYNKEKDDMLKYCIESLLNQTLKKTYEIIAVDDASTDNSLQILMDYQARFPEKVKVIHREKNGRQGAARNDGIRVAQGKWLGFVDADDWVSADMYDKLICAVDREDADSGGVQVLRIKKHIFNVSDIADSDKYLIASNLQTGILDFAQKEKILRDGELMVNKIFRKSLFEENDLFFPENMFYEDIAVAKFFLIKSSKFALVDEPLYYYYENLESTCHTVDIEKVRDRLKAADVFWEKKNELNFEDEYKQVLEYSWFRNIYISTLPHIWNVKLKWSDRMKFLFQIKKRIRANNVNILKNNYFLELKGRIREYKVFNSSLILFWMYHLYECYIYEWRIQRKHSK